MRKRPKILVTKLGLDGHDRGAKVVAKALKDSGFEVVYLGVHRTPEEVIRTAIEEDVDAIGVSILSGSHLELINDLMKLAKKEGINVPIIVGGIIPPEDIPKLKGMGVVEVCPPGTSLKDIVELFKRVTSREQS
ncbi:MAG: methylmalonyl-CoA mutase [Desulfurococcales archaeon ex4484_42]|nr:MAG: methylmalonyl-CoA mutase [Desulfurococcales archaeon ex4484_42]